MKPTTNKENLKKAVWAYVERHRNNWSATTTYTVPSKLHTLIDLGFDPQSCFDALVERGYKRYTVKVYFVIASRFEEKQLNRTSKFGKWLKENSKAFANAYKDKTKRLDEKTLKEAIMIASAPGKERIYNLLLLMAYGGLRISEAKLVEWDHFQEDVLQLVGKGSKQRFVPFLKTWLKSTDTPFPVGSFAPADFFKRYLPGFSPHDLRAWCITEWARSPDLHLKDVALLAGHASTSTTDRYVRTHFGKVKKVLLYKRDELVVSKLVKEEW